MSDVLRPITALLISAGILLMGNGLLTVLVPVRAEIEAFTALQIGVMGTAYFSGLLAGCFLCPVAVARVGHVRAFTAFTAVATLTPLVHAMTAEPVLWWALRFLTGICIAGVHMVIESWLNGSSTNTTRGTVLSVYTVLNLTVVAVGQMMLALGDPADFQLFSLVAILISLGAVPIALSRAPTPHIPQAARLRLVWLYRVSPVGFTGCFVTGLSNGAFWSLGPVFAAQAGLSVAWIAFFMAAAVAGAAVVQWPAGFLSDRMDRRRVILSLALVATVGGVLLALLAGAAPPVLLALSFLFGSASMTIYAVSMAHANDFTARDSAVEVSSGLLLLYAAGAIAGPLLASAMMQAAGASGLFVYTACVHLLFLGFVAVRMRERAAPPEDQREGFIAVPRTTPAVFTLDPRSAGEPPAQDVATAQEAPASA